MYSDQLQEIFCSQILINECCVHGSIAAAEDELEQIRALEEKHRMDEAYQILKQAVEKISNGENTVLRDTHGIRSVMVRVAAMNCETLMNGSLQGLHPAFRCGKKRIREIWVSKYINCLVEGKAASLPMAVPAGIHHFEEALQYTSGKGEGWLLMPYQLRSAILLDCWRRGVNPSGNTDIGRNYYNREEIGIRTGAGTVLTGSGPLTWTHNGRREGIWDLVGNLNEWDSGLRLMNGEIQMIDMEDLIRSDCDQSIDSPAWKAMDADGHAVAPGSGRTLCFDGHDGAVRLTDEVMEKGLGNCAFCDVSVKEGLTVPDKLRILGLFPADERLAEKHGWRWINTEGEAMPLCGGAFRIMNHSGLFFMGVTKPRNVNYGLSGMRCVYIAPEAIQEGDDVD